ncbi:MAG: 4Fe-4S dicluster domain-containing protein [Peptococcaceae bacterium]
MGKFVIDINKKWCKGCSICVDFCPKNVLFINDENKGAVGNIENCTGCMMCEYRCPDYAIRVEAN